MSNPVPLNEPGFDIGRTPELAPKVHLPSAGYFHTLPAEVPGRVHIVRTSIPMGAKAFANKLPTMVQWENFVWVANVDAALAEACLYGLNASDKGMLDAHATALEEAKRAVGRKYYVRAVMHCVETGGWWVTLGGPRRFRHWRELGLFSATTALFATWDDLRGMQYDPHEHDVSNYVKLDIPKMLVAAGVTLKKLKKHPSWYDVTTPKPYLTTAGAALVDAPYQPIDPAAYPVQSAQCDGLDGLLPDGLMGGVPAPGDLAGLQPHQGEPLRQYQATPPVYDRAAEDAREQRELEQRLANMRNTQATGVRFWND